MQQCTLDQDVLPILMVPGIMGSRLHRAGDARSPIWDPDHTMAMLRLADMFTSYRAELLSVRTRAEVFVQPREAANCTAAQVRRGWGGVAWGFYGTGLVDLERRSADLGGVVYAFGYDWRMSNRLNGLRLKERIAEIRRAHGNRKVLVVTHSMGGLVTRSACVQGAQDDVLGVVHTMQPATGTPVAYRQSKAGAAALHWVPADVVLGRIIGRTPVQAAAVGSGMRGAFELFPTDNHWRASGNEEREPPGQPTRRTSWLSYDASIPVTFAPGFSIYDVYLEQSGVLGLIDYRLFRRTPSMHINEAYILDDYVNGPAIADGITAGVNGARAFHRELLRDYVHPNTSNVAGNGLECDVATNITRETRWFGPDTAGTAMIREARGDGTVSVSSATALRLNGVPAQGITDSQRQVFVNGVEHAAAFGASAPFRDKVWDMCEQVLLCAPTRS